METVMNIIEAVATVTLFANPFSGIVKWLGL